MTQPSAACGAKAITCDTPYKRPHWWRTSSSKATRSPWLVASTATTAAGLEKTATTASAATTSLGYPATSTSAPARRARLATAAVMLSPVETPLISSRFPLNTQSLHVRSIAPVLDDESNQG